MVAAHTPLGSGLSVSDGRGYCTPQRPQAFPLTNRTWLAIIQGVENGVCVRSWTGPEFPTKAEALAAAQAKATGEQPRDQQSVGDKSREEP